MKKSWSRMYLRRCSTVSRGSQLGGLTTQRSFSMSTKLSELKLQTATKRYNNRRQSSLSDPEQSVPFTSNIDVPSDVIDDADEIEMASSREEAVTQNGRPRFNVGEIELKINVVNIECQGSDGIRRNTTALDIQTLKNGCTINSENVLNNNIEETGLNEPVDPEYSNTS